MFIPASASRKVRLEFPISALAVWDEQQDKFAVKLGAYKIMLGSSSADIRTSAMIKLA